MSLKTRFGNLANILDTEDRRDGVLVLELPVLTGADWARLKAHFGRAAAEIDCTFDAGRRPRDAARRDPAHPQPRPSRRCARARASCS